ncbi:MarR family winged helix-turn-helix transcriptional regulator [Romboutsia sp.]|uniref:MarR family winged helix-turn-helix transcriptional regulator n=1 Tax=Romboutsia sp. TaxID=1965302 RepID=UPI003F3F75EE
MEFEIINTYKNEIIKDFRKYAQEALKNHEFKVSDIKYLVIIEQNKNIKLNELSILLNVDKAVVTRTIKRLEDLGYVKKKKDEKDTRSSKLSLNKKSEESLQDLRGIFKDWFDKVTYSFTEEEKQLYINFMKRVYENRIYKN